MIDLYYWPTPNGHKITIMLEECGIEYRIIPVDIGKGEQFAPEFLQISPNNRIPAIVDHEAQGGPLRLFESGAILLYLAERTGRFMSNEAAERLDVLQWLFWQIGNLGPMAGQCHHFRNYAPEQLPYGIARYTDEVNRLYGVMERRLAGREYLAGEYSIADIACWPWITPERQGQRLAEFPALERWREGIGRRPAVVKALEMGQPWSAPLMTEQARKILFGQTAASLNRPR